MNQDAITTEAHQIAELFDGDGQKFTAETGEDLFDVLEKYSTSKDQDWDNGRTAFIFSDDSSIVVAGPAWDLGLSPDCFCWAGVGHTCGTTSPTFRF